MAKKWKDPNDEKTDFSDLLISLVNSKLQDENYPLYQTLSQLISRTQQETAKVNTTLQSFFGRVTITDDVDLTAILTAISNVDNILKFATFVTELSESTSLPASRQLTAGLNIIIDVSVPGQIIISSSGVVSNLLQLLTWADESASLPNSRQLLAGLGITFDDTVANQRTINSAASAEAIHPFLLMGG